MADQGSKERKRGSRRRKTSVPVEVSPRAAPTLDRNRLEHALAENALLLALGAIPAPAFVIRTDGEIVRANEAGWAWAREDEPRSKSALAKVMVDPTALPCRVTFLDPLDGIRHALVVLEIAALEEMKSLEQAVRRWSLTPRQAEVLALLAEGKSNRLIAATLGCSERTVEIHVAALLEKADCDSRAELIAQFWKPAR